MFDQWRATGAEAIAGREDERIPLPWSFDRTVFRCAWEYSVTDFETEVGFWIEGMGFTTLALDDEYALFTTPDQELTFACRRRDPGANLAGHVLCFMTNDIDEFGQALRARLPVGFVTRRDGSPVQTVLGLKTPAGLQVDIWEHPDNPPA